MPMDYSIAGRWALHVEALAIVESGGSPMVGYSDGGRARGLLGQHPSFFVEWYGRYPEIYPAEVTDEWWTADIKAAASFLEHYSSFGLDQEIQMYNLGVVAVVKGARNPEYLARWSAAYQKLRAANGQNVPTV
jgi:hypothetical protein